MNTPKNTHLNNRIGTETEGEGQNGPIVTFKGTKRNLSLVEADAQTKAQEVQAPLPCPGCGSQEPRIVSLCDECLGLAAFDPVGHGWLYNILAELPESIPDAPVDYWDTIVHARSDYALLQTQKRPDSIRYGEQEPGPEELGGLALDAYTYSSLERRLSGLTWEGKAEAVGKAIRLKKSLWGDLAGYLASFARRVPHSEPNRQSLIEDLEQYLWKELLQASKRLKGDWEAVKLTISGRYHDWYKDWNAYRALASDAHGNAISLERRAYAERDLEGHDEWLEADADPRSLRWETYVEAQASYEYLLQVLPPEIRELVEKKALDVPLVASERKRLSRWLRGGPTKRRTAPDGRTSDTPANSFQVYLILEGGLPAGRNGIVSWHKAQRT